MATQEEIPGTESQERIPELHALAAELYDLQEKRKAATSDEKAKREECGEALKRYGLTEYHVDGFLLYLDGNPKVKVRRDKDEEG